MNDARIERLTREALGPRRRQAYSTLDDAVLRAVGIVVLIVVVIVFASWPREEAQSDANPGAASSYTPAPVRSAAERSNEPKPASLRTADHSPLY